MTTLDKLRILELKMFDYFIDVCAKYNLQWFSDAGTTLGTVRHGGFIPWDDDMDIMMPRKDYNRLLEIGPVEFNDPYFFQTPLTDTTSSVHIKIRYNNTTCMTKFDSLGTHHRGVFIDIFPLDAIPDDEEVYKNEIGFVRCLCHDTTFKFAGYKNHKEVSIIDSRQAFIMLNKVLTDLSEQNSSSKLVTDMAMHRFRKIIGLKYNRADYSSYLEFDFKGLKHKIRVPIGYDNILTAQYGDWRIEKHEPSIHNTLLVDLEHNYDKYDNITFEEYDRLVEENAYDK